MKYWNIKKDFRPGKRNTRSSSLINLIVQSPEDKSSDKNQLGTVKNIIAVLRDTIVFFAILLYFVGWVYLNEYLSHFGIYLSNLELPFYYYFIYSYSPIFSALLDPSLADILRFIVLVTLIIICVFSYKKSAKYGHISATALCVGIFLIFFHLALEKSHLHASYVINGGGKKIKFIFKEDVLKKYEKELRHGILKDNAESNLRLVWRTDKEVYAVRIRNKLDPSRPIVTYRIPNDLFLMTEVVGNYSD